MPAPDHARERRFEALLAEVGLALRRYLLRRTGPDDVDDVLAEVTLVLWRRLDDVPEEALPWAYGVARGCLRNQERSRRRQHRLAQRVGAHASITDGELPAEDDLSLSSALASLPPRDREILALWAWEELSASEIAVVLGVTANAASIRLHRAKRKLRTAYVVATRKPTAPTGHLSSNGVEGESA